MIMSFIICKPNYFVQTIFLFTYREQCGIMNTAMDHHDQEQFVLDEALQALERVAGVHGRVVAREQRIPGRRFVVDALVEVAAGGKPHDFVAEVKAVDRLQAVGYVKAQLEEMRGAFPDHDPLLVTRFITPRMADECRMLDLPYMDTAGNAYLRGPGLLVYVTGQPKPRPPARVDYRANTQAGLKIVFALLCNPTWVACTYRELAHYAGVALGAIGPVLRDLEERGFLRKTKAKGIVMENRRQLFEQWVMRYPEILRPKLEPRRYQADLDRLLHADLQGTQAYWGGERGAQLLTEYLFPEQFTLYLRGRAPELLKQLRVRLDPLGNTEILEVFWTHALDDVAKPVAPPMLVYADLVNTGIARNVEAAKLVYERFIQPTLGEE